MTKIWAVCVIMNNWAPRRNVAAEPGAHAASQQIELTLFFLNAEFEGFVVHSWAVHSAFLECVDVHVPLLC
jgi:hypothetical protein